MTSLADVRPGDLFFTKIGGIVPGVFPVKAGQLMLKEHARIGRRSFDHVGIVVENVGVGGAGIYHAPRAVQAMPRGAEEISLTEGRHWADDVTFMRIPEDYPGQAQDAAALARAMIGTPYSFLSYAALAAWSWGLDTPRLEEWIGRRKPDVSMSLPSYTFKVDIALPEEAICSVLVDQAWSLAGKRIMIGIPHQAVTPGALASRLLWMPGVQKFGKGILEEV